jgi:hypothetical protein
LIRPPVNPRVIPGRIRRVKAKNAMDDNEGLLVNRTDFRYGLKEQLLSGGKKDCIAVAMLLPGVKQREPSLETTARSTAREFENFKPACRLDDVSEPLAGASLHCCTPLGASDGCRRQAVQQEIQPIPLHNVRFACTEAGRVACSRTTRPTSRYIWPRTRTVSINRLRVRGLPNRTSTTCGACMSWLQSQSMRSAKPGGVTRSGACRTRRKEAQSAIAS